MTAALCDLRCPDWPEQLACVLEAASLRGPAGWGAGDCLALACAAATAQGRADLVPPAPVLAGRTSAVSARRLARRLGSMAEWLAARCAERQPGAVARRGDLIVVPASGAARLESIGVVDATGVWFADPQAGLLRLRPAEVLGVPGARVFDLSAGGPRG